MNGIWLNVVSTKETHPWMKQRDSGRLESFFLSEVNQQATKGTMSMGLSELQCHRRFGTYVKYKEKIKELLYPKIYCI